VTAPRLWRRNHHANQTSVWHNRKLSYSRSASGVHIKLRQGKPFCTSGWVYQSQRCLRPHLGCGSPQWHLGILDAEHHTAAKSLEPGSDLAPIDIKLASIICPALRREERHFVESEEARL